MPGVRLLMQASEGAVAEVNKNNSVYVYTYITHHVAFDNGSSNYQIIVCAAIQWTHF